MAKFCSKCGRRLEEGETCICVEMGQQTNNQERTKEAQWVNEKKEAFVSGTRNMFSEILPIIKAPVTTSKNIAAKNSPSIGMQFIIVKTAIFLLIILIAIGKLTNELGEFVEYVNIPYLDIIVLTVAMTVGIDCLEALIMKLFTGIANGITNWNEMVTMTGVRALYETVIILITIVLWMISKKAAVCAFALLSVVTVFVQYSSYQVMVRINEDKKPYVFAAVKICMVIIVYFLVTIIAKNQLGPAWDQAENMISTFL